MAESKSILLPAAVVNDEPRFTYRAMHLDVCRHFFPVEFVKKYIDLLALHNMNTFHWHLTDDQGWRIESKKYPKLNEIGSVRHRTVVGYLGSGEYDNTDYGGYYTQEQMKEVVAYAAERYINVLPEIDLPGHTLSVLPPIRSSAARAARMRCVPTGVSSPTYSASATSRPCSSWRIFWAS